MLKLTKKADYGLIALKHLAVNQARGSCQRQRDRRYLRHPAAAAFEDPAEAGESGLSAFRARHQRRLPLGARSARNHRARSHPHHRRPDLPDVVLHRARLLHPVRALHRAGAAAQVHEGILRLLSSITISDMSQEERTDGDTWQPRPPVRADRLRAQPRF